MTFGHGTDQSICKTVLGFSFFGGGGGGGRGGMSQRIMSIAVDTYVETFRF